jgi:hypothetical protein
MDEEQAQPHREEWRAPLRLGGGGLALLLAGYFLMNSNPLPQHAAERQYAQWKQMHDMAARDPQQKELAEKLERMEPPPPNRPWRVLGVVAFWAGLLLFIAAGIRMYHHKPAEGPPAGEGPAEEPEEKNPSPAV